MRLKFKDGVVGQSCLSELNLCNFWAFEPGAKEYAESHTIADLKELQTSGKDFTNIQDQILTMKQRKNFKKNKKRNKRDKRKLKF